MTCVEGFTKWGELEKKGAENSIHKSLLNTLKREKGIKENGYRKLCF